jgi:hypothetical protein
MVTVSIETRIKKLKAKVEILKKSLQNSTTIIEVMNLQSLCSQLLGVDFSRMAYDLFALKNPRFRNEGIEGGVLEQPEAARRALEAHNPGKDAPQVPGGIGLVYVTMPYIVVSKDGKTVKGVWNSWGPHAMINTPYPGDVRKMVQYWYFGRYNNEFIQEESKWKIVSNHHVQYLRTPYDQGWLRQPDCRRVIRVKGAKLPSVINLLAPYHSDGIFQPVPEPPEPE